jgi:hypothetical protein
MRYIGGAPLTEDPGIIPFLFFSLALAMAFVVLP